MVVGVIRAGGTALLSCALACSADREEPPPTDCRDAEQRIGHRACVHAVDDVQTWNGTSVPYATRTDVARVSKYLVPATDDAPLPTMFADANHYRVHFCLLTEAFEPQFGGMDFADYPALVFARATRRFYAGSTYALAGPDTPTGYGFIAEAFDTDGELLSLDEVAYVHRSLQARFGAGELAYVPTTPQQEARAAEWESPPFAVFVRGSGDVTFEGYATGVAYGRVRRYEADAVDTAAGTFGWQDILVLGRSSNVLEGVNAGVITGTRQDLLSHLNVLAAQRGTPNAFVADPLAAFAPYDGALVRLDVDASTYTVTLADPTDAEAFWREHRPLATIRDAPDRDYLELPALADVPTTTANERATALSRIGGKGTGLAMLARILDPAHQVDGLAIPVGYGLTFMQDNRWDAPVGAATERLSYAATLERWLAEPTFRTDGALRQARLDALGQHMREASVVDDALVEQLRDRIIAVFGSAEVMVRFRSSSTAEDGAQFGGAGLYDSTRACALDTEEVGASGCDERSSARPIADALRRVWASQWSFGAFEERDYYQMDHARTAMAVAVTTRFADERANGIVFTGNPLDPDDDRFTVNAQRGEVDVVSSEPGTTAELSRITVRDGRVSSIDRVARSTIPPHDVPVLSDGELEELGTVVAEVRADYPAPPVGTLLDLEFKIDATGQLKIKQVRPFRATAQPPSLDNCALH